MTRRLSKVSEGDPKIFEHDRKTEHNQKFFEDGRPGGKGRFLKMARSTCEYCLKITLLEKTTGIKYMDAPCIGLLKKYKLQKLIIRNCMSLNINFLYLERFSNECRKTKTKVITPANHNRHKLPNEPIRN